jgi:REP-associated tyrosine transposase
MISYCLMPNHWHLVVGPVDPIRLSKLMHWVTVTHAVRWHHHRNTVGLGPVYQNRFWSEVLPRADDLVRACRYVERNALRARLTRRAQDWPWGSLAERLRPEPGSRWCARRFFVRERGSTT